MYKLDEDLRAEYWDEVKQRILLMLDATNDYSINELKELKENLKNSLELILSDENSFNDVADYAKKLRRD